MISFNEEMNAAAADSTKEIVESARVAAGFLMGLNSAIEDHLNTFGEVYIGASGASISSDLMLGLIDDLQSHLDRARKVIKNGTTE